VHPPAAERLTVSDPADASEREADALALAMTRPHLPDPHLPDPHPGIRPTLGSTPSALRPPDPGAASPAPLSPDAHRKVRDVSGGRVLTSAESARFAPRFGRLLGEVRVHDDARADAAARALDARAYTLGRQVVVRSGAYAPGTAAGDWLLAHELTHVEQQAGSRLVLQRQTRPPPVAVPPVAPPAVEGVEPADLANAGVLALGSLLRGGLADEAEVLRAIYNAGTSRIAAEEARMMAEVAAGRLTTAEVARRLSGARHQLAQDVRRAGSALNRQFAQIFDRARGNLGRPTYDTLRAAGKTDLEIIRSASRTNAFVNTLPSRMRWAGRGFWFVSAGISIFVVLDAPPEQRGAVAQDEVEGFVGGAAGSAGAAGVCVATGVATGGWGLVVCGLLGGLVGATAAREFNLLELMDIAPHHQPGRAGTVYLVEGEWDVTDLFIVGWVNREVRRSEHVLVMSTGRVSGSQMSGRYGHYRSEEVRPANAAAVTLFGGTEPRWVRQGLLTPARLADLESPEDLR
jgi:hypothetical protein